MENSESTAPVVEHFSELEDPRRYNRRHYLRDILVSVRTDGAPSSAVWHGPLGPCSTPDSLYSTNRSKSTMCFSSVRP